MDISFTIILCADKSFSPKINEDDCISPLVFLGNIQPDLQLHVANLTSNVEHIVSDTMNLWIDLFPELLYEVLKKSTIFFINHEEAEQFTGESDISAAGQKLLCLGPRVVVIKMGAAGSYAVSYTHLTLPPIREV